MASHGGYDAGKRARVDRSGDSTPKVSNTRPKKRAPLTGILIGQQQTFQDDASVDASTPRMASMEIERRAALDRIDLESKAKPSAHWRAGGDVCGSWWREASSWMDCSWAHLSRKELRKRKQSQTQSSCLIDSAALLPFCASTATDVDHWLAASGGIHLRVLFSSRLLPLLPNNRPNDTTFQRGLVESRYLPHTRRRGGHPWPPQPTPTSLCSSMYVYSLPFPARSRGPGPETQNRSCLPPPPALRNTHIHFARPPVVAWSTHTQIPES